jgi:predicted aconitase with swiveling domain
MMQAGRHDMNSLTANSPERDAFEGEVLVAGEPGEGEALVLSAPISFWGGVDPPSGRITDVRHPECGQLIAGKVLFLPGTIGSSSASAVLLELVRNGRAPAAIVMHEADAILLLGLIVAKEMGWPTPIAVRLDRTSFTRFESARVAVDVVGGISILGQPRPVRSSS